MNKLYGWRGRIGLLIPSSNTTMEPEFYKMAPKGVSIHTARMRVHEQTIKAELKMVEDLEKVSEEVADAEVNVIVFGCTTGSLIKGVGYDKELASRIEKAVSIPAVVTTTAVVESLKTLEAKRISVATPYPRELNKREEQFLRGMGFDVVAIKGLELMRNTDVGRQPPYIAYNLAKSVDKSEADCIFISCTNFRTVEIIERLERDLGKPIVTSNQATMWAALRKIRIREPIKGFGTLMHAL
jgi:maleate isomerase